MSDKLTTRKDPASLAERAFTALGAKPSALSWTVFYVGLVLVEIVGKVFA